VRLSFSSRKPSSDWSFSLQFSLQQRKLSKLEADVALLKAAKNSADEAAKKAEAELAEAVEKYRAEWNERKRIFNQVSSFLITQDSEIDTETNIVKLS
jgi:hypothetical protein